MESVGSGRIAWGASPRSSIPVYELVLSRRAFPNGALPVELSQPEPLTARGLYAPEFPTVCGPRARGSSRFPDTNHPVFPQPGEKICRLCHPRRATARGNAPSSSSFVRLAPFRIPRGIRLRIRIRQVPPTVERSIAVAASSDVFDRLLELLQNAGRDVFKVLNNEPLALAILRGARRHRFRR